MRFAGRLTDWHDDKGYGFVVPNGGGERAFVHIKAFERTPRRPELGDIVSYEAHRDDKGRLAALRVRFAGQAVAAPKPPRGGLKIPHAALGCIVIAALAISAWRGWLPMPAAGLYGFMSVFSLALYWGDKRSAQGGTWRTPEATLHAVDVFGGWPGALIAQGVLRHKSRKPKFQFAFWFTVIVNCAVMAWLLRQT
jgi:uncharacterized membrane protein YsdA (DUF1294 family)/cold shock CspA family protein